uniref:Sodium/potassium-transporting ATPase subunit alpha n=1 Tax=Parascaris univalens TaxID=6257 RepID=A0A915C373_PARUN
ITVKDTFAQLRSPSHALLEGDEEERCGFKRAQTRGPNGRAHGTA